MDQKPKTGRLEHKQQITGEQQVESQTAGRMFESPEEMIRHDAQQTALPPGLAGRLQDSLAAHPPPSTEPVSWWRRLWGHQP